ncbi:MAG: ParB/Srx family N-terminal domain-containing protein [Christensenellales bacterium]
MEELKIEYIEIEKLNHYDNNSKIHTKEQIEHIANSIKEFGFNDPLGIAGEDNIVLEGNGRVEAAKLLDMKKLPCVRLDHLTKEEQQAYVIAHNSLNLETGFDDGILFQELKRLQEFDFTDFGIDVDRYLKTCIRVQKRLLKPIKKVHYLISLDINKNDQIAHLIDRIKRIEGVELESTTN